MELLESGSESVQDSREFDEDEHEHEHESTDTDDDGDSHMDNRLLWIKDRVVKFLRLQGHERLFNELINANNRQLEDQLMNFLILDTLGVTDLEKKVVFFYKTFTTETVHEEVSVWEETGPRAKLTAQSVFTAKGRARRLTKSAPGKVEKSDEEGRRKTKKPKKVKGKLGKEDSRALESVVTLRSDLSSPRLAEDEGADDEEDDRSGLDTEDGGGDLSVASKKKAKSAPADSSNFVPPRGQEDKYVLTKKTVERVRSVPQLRAFCGELDGNRADLQAVNLFYFLRSRDEGVPYFDTFDHCEENITSYLIIGTLNGKFLPTMNQLLVHVFKPLLECQFRAVTVGDKREPDDSSDEDSTDVEKTVSKLASIIEARTSAIRRPSDFRRMSLMNARREAENQQTDDVDSDEVRGRGLGSPFPDAKKSKASIRSRSAARLASSGYLPQSNKSLAKDHVEAATQQSKADILDYLDKLINCVEWTLEHVEGDILLTMPNIAELNDPTITDESLAANKSLVERMEEVIMSWGQHIQKVVDSFTRKVPQGKGPMAEYDYWHDRETGLSMLVEQLNSPVVKRMQSLLNKALSSIPSAFEYFQVELWNRYTEARDNTRFLFTVLRHFKLIRDSDCFKSIGDSIPSLMQSLRMIWVLSTYYSSEANMMGLMERISWQLSENIASNLSIKKIFKLPLSEILRMTKDAHATMRNWKASYMRTREDIELSGKGARWEFDQRRLFRRTEYIASVASDLNKAARVLQDFYNVFGAELKAALHEPAQVDAIVKRIGSLVVPIQEADFDVFNEFNDENWAATMAWFYEEVAFLENDTKFLVDECFAVLISAEQALEVLLKLKNVRTRPAIQERLSNKFDIIMQQFSKEIGMVENIYNRGKRNPPLLTYHPPSAGAVFWVRQLFHRLRRPVLIFQSVDELKHSDVKLIAFSQYLDIAKQMKAFEEAKFAAWVDKAQLVVLNTMKRSVLKMVRVERDKDTVSFPVDGKNAAKGLQVARPSRRSRVGSQLGIAGTPPDLLQKGDVAISKPSIDTTSSGGVASKPITSRGQIRSDTQTDGRGSLSRRTQSVASLADKQTPFPTKLTWTEFMSETISIECQLRYQVNFDWQLFDMIHEAEIMERLGFELPAIVRDVGIQKERLKKDIEAIEKMVDRYNGIVDTLDKADILLLKNTLLTVEKHINPGVIRFNWNSLSVGDYAADCGKLLKTLTSVVGQVDQMKRELDHRIESEMQTYNLFSLNSEVVDAKELLPCKTYFLEIECRRTELVCAMTKVYRSASPMLVKLESLVEGTSTGKSPAMQLFYDKYAKQIFAALVTCMVRNLDYLCKMLSGDKAMFQVDAVLVTSEAVLRPSPSEIYNIIMHNVRNLLENLRNFPRWMNGSCLECRPTKREGADEYVTFSFFEDVMCVQVVNDAITTVHEVAHRIAGDCSRYVYRWKKYANLWSYDKNLVCEKFSSTRPTLLQYDEKLTFYDGILEELEEMRDHYDINCVRINLRPLMSGIEGHAKEWKQTLGGFLVAETVREMDEFGAKIANFRAEVELVITGLERFTLIMQAISDVKRMAIQAEVWYTTYQETFRTLRAHKVEFDEEHERTAHQLQHDWESLYLGALYRASTLESTSEKFAEMTCEQIDAFAEEIARFARDFQLNGPGNVGEDLDLGVKKMDEYGKEIEKYEERRLHLMNSEILFDLPPADYTAFLAVKRDHEGLDLLYKLYRQQKSARESWAKTLWVDLNPQQLIDGMEHFIKEFRRLPKHVKSMPVGRTLDGNMKSFKNSVPLFVELKNEAMRERHWQELMRRTGQYFDMNPDRCEDEQGES